MSCFQRCFTAFQSAFAQYAFAIDYVPVLPTNGNFGKLDMDYVPTVNHKPQYTCGHINWETVKQGG